MSASVPAAARIRSRTGATWGATSVVSSPQLRMISRGSSTVAWTGRTARGRGPGRVPSSPRSQRAVTSPALPPNAL